MGMLFMNGAASFQSELTIEEVGKFISERILAGNELGGLEKNIFDEVPALFVEQEILGLRITLSGYSGYDMGQHYVFDISPSYSGMKYVSLDEEKDYVSDYLNKLIDSFIRDDSRFRIIEKR